MALRIYDLEGTDITPRVIGLDVNVERCVATVVVKDMEGKLRFYNERGAPETMEVGVWRIEGSHAWGPPPPAWPLATGPDGPKST